MAIGSLVHGNRTLSSRFAASDPAQHLLRSRSAGCEVGGDIRNRSEYQQMLLFKQIALQGATAIIAVCFYCTGAQNFIGVGRRYRITIRQPDTDSHRVQAIRPARISDQRMLAMQTGIPGRQRGVVAPSGRDPAKPDYGS